MPRQRIIPHRCIWCQRTEAHGAAFNNVGKYLQSACHECRNLVRRYQTYQQRLSRERKPHKPQSRRAKLKAVLQKHGIGGD